MLKIERITKTYPGVAKPVFDPLTFAVDSGEALWVSGPSGSGKSTLLNVLGLLTGVDGGRYLIDGKDFTRASKQERCRARLKLISTVFQHGNLFNHLSVLDNLLIGTAGGTRVAAMEQLESVGMERQAHQVAGLLSGGEQARVAFARAAARRSPVLLADEPIAGLDPDNADTVLDLLSTAAHSGTAVVVVSHDSRAARIATARLALAGKVGR